LKEEQWKSWDCTDARIIKYGQCDGCGS